MSDLKPCPHGCDHKYLCIQKLQPVIYRRELEKAMDHAVCEECGFSAPVDAWNRRASSWVSVKDRLPEPGEWVVARRNEKRPFACRTVHHKNVNCWIQWLDADNLTRDPTHWMPLPEPPQ